MSRSLLLAVLLPAPLGLVTTQAADREPAMVAPGSDAMTEADIAAGAAEDTSGACMARIPNDASIGQVMIAEHPIVVFCSNSSQWPPG